ncbi:hypothetical protein DICPUDRAFT_49420 [Dictyostelium purpureum]|uniref:Aminopeptidase n=1 Tax=Dictyostelium purpureum TaxID=5786 RepID=F0ZTN6_DICPU|nr:uncharacterized protein DICPUDRAFT_49420 [Dictyostelium purpureum]EGC32677.1 hypothetical protein DICPUDRAFT_49420 [Dictyostelium purpureum]|eukprot:XP_003290780.1 hypothetical protein DICPUDRAFT_49420 [Dictyostelium purpureum]
MCRNKNKQYLIDKVDRLVLPDNIKPKSYNIHLVCDTKQFKYNGEEEITVDITQSTDTIVIHSIDIEIQQAEILNQKAISIEYDQDDEIAILKFEQPLKVSSDSKLRILFTGIINDKLKGFYRSKYNADGEDHWIFSTQFEAPDARRAFPCFDEPSLKATFNLKLTIDKNLTAISNTMETEILENNNQTKTFTFETTPIMSTYLVAFVIGDLEYIEAYSKIDKTRVRVYKGRGVKDSSEYALEIGVKALDFFVEYFGISFPLKKIDHAAIPSFSFYAMENWGLLTYLDIYLLTSDKTTLVNKREMVDMISHEISHQWFGNLVTMEWWSQLWLNEGFANFCGYLSANHLFPEWKMWKEFSQNHRNKALTLDALQNTHPIEVPVYSTSQIQEIFDDISYNKGACIVQMLENRLGCDSFKKAINQYLNKHSYKNTVTEDLWESLSLESNGLDVSKFINSFTKEPGYPVITIEETEVEGTFKLKQKRFTFDKNSNNKTIWSCFIRFLTEQGEYSFTLEKESDTFTIPNFKRGQWIKPNYGQTSFLRIDYNQEILVPLVPKIKSMELSAVDRLGVLSDLFNVCKSGSKEISLYMDLLLNAFSDETDSDVWTFIVQTIGEIGDVIFDQPYKEKFNRAVVTLLTGISNKLGFDPIENEDSGNTLLRSIVNTKLALLGYEPIVNESKKRYEQFKLDKTSLNPNIAKFVLTSVLHNGGEIEQKEIISQYLNTTDIAEKIQYLQVLSYGSPTEQLYENMLKFSLTPAVQINDTQFLWNTSHPEFKYVSWKMFTENFKQIDTIFKDNILYTNMIYHIFSSKLSNDQLNEINQFFTSNPVELCDCVIKQELEKIINNNNWFNNSNFNLNNWLDKQKL